MEEENKNPKPDMKLLAKPNETVIFESKKSEEILQKAYARTNAIINGIADAFYSLDNQWRFITINPVAERAPFGRPASELIGKIIWDVYPNLVGTRIQQHYLDAVEKRTQEHYEAMSPLNGHWYEVFMFPQEDGLDIYLRDIDERKKIEGSLRESENKYKELVENANSFIFKLDTEGKITFCNEAAERFFGFTKEEMYGKDPTETISPKIETSGRNLTEAFKKIYEDPDKHSLHINENVKKNGKRVWVEWSNKALFDNDEHKIGHMAIGTDITERIKAEEEIKRLATFPELNPNPILELDLEGNILYQNPTIKKLFPDLQERGLNHPWLVNFKSLVEELLNTATATIDRDISVGENYYHKKIHYLPEQKRIRIYGIDITDQKKEELELYKLNRTLTALSNSNQLLMKSSDETVYLNGVCDIIVKDCKYEMVWIGYAENNEEKSIKPVAFAGFDREYLETLNLTWADKERGQGPTGIAIRTGEMSVCENIQTDPKFAPWREEALTRGYASSIVFPMNDKEKTFGAITIYSKNSNPFTNKEIILLKELASDVSYGVVSLRTKQARLEAEELLQKNEAKLQAEKNVLHTIMDNAQAGVAYIDRDFNFVAVNSIFCQNNGRNEEELLRKNYFDFFPSLENQLLFEKVRDTGEQIRLNQKPLIARNQPWQDITYWNWTITPVKNSDGHVYGLVISLVDVSESVRSIENLKVHGHKLEQMTTELKKVRTAVENASDIIFITDEKGKIIYINRAIKNILGYKQKDLIGRKPNFWMEDMPNKFFGQMWRTIYFNKEPFVGEIQDRKKDGEIFTAEIRIAPVLDKNGQILSFVGIERDITEAKRLDTAKTEFISMAAHQLRTPITNVSLTAEMLLGGLSGSLILKDLYPCRASKLV